MAGRHKVKKNGRLVQQRHGDCFVHAPSSWLNYWPISLPSENLMLVKVTLENGSHFLTSISPKPLPLVPTGFGYSRAPPRDLEIDTNFARLLGISSYSTEVLVEAVGDIERCTRLCLEPLAPEHLDKLESNQEKIEYELLNRIRVVSGHSFCFPIWINNDIISVRVVSSEPGATWVLLGSELTGVRGEAATVLTFKRPNELSPASSSGSYQSPPTPGRLASDSPYSASPAWGQLQGNSVNSSPDVDLENASISSSTGSRLFEFFRPFLSALNAPGTVQVESGSERSETKTPEPAGHSAPSTVAPKTKFLAHRKSKSCSQILDSNSSPQRLPKYVDTPEMNALLRVQPHPIRGPGEISPGVGNSPPHWDHSRAFDVYVHPTTLPEIANHYHSSKNLGSFLVQIKPAKARAKWNSSNQGKNETANPPPSSLSLSNALSSLAENESISSPVNETGFELRHIMSAVASLNDSQSDTSDGASSVKSDKPLNLVLPDSLVVRLCFATTLVSCTDNRVRPLPHPLPSPLPKLFAEAEEVLKVAPGHILMSDIVRRQLRIGSCSLVRVSSVKDEGRLPAGLRSVTIHLRPLNEQSSLMKMHREAVEEGVKEWVQEVGDENPFGTILVSHQVIHTFNPNGGSEYCSVEVGSSRTGSAGSKGTHQPLLQYVMITPQEMAPPHRSPRVKYVVEKTKWSSGGVVSLPSLVDLDSPAISLNPSHFGAFEEMIEKGRVYLRSALCRRGNRQRSGQLLIAGSTGDAGLACGKTSLAKLIVHFFASHPNYAHVQYIDCTAFRGQTAVRIGKRLTDIFATAIECEPSVVILDDLHNAMPNFSEGEDQTSGEAALSTRNAQALLDQLALLDQSQARVVVVATTRCRQDLHPLLRQSRGCHVFEEFIEIQPPDLAGRESILSAVMEARDVYLDGNPRCVAVRTEGCQAGDLNSLVDRAIGSYHIRHTCPDATRLRLPNPLKKRGSSRVSFTLDDLDVMGGGSGFSSPLITRSLPASPLKERKKLKDVKSQSFTEGSPPSTENVNLSIQTLTTERPDSGLGMKEGKLRLIVRDFDEALVGFVPLALQSLSLHSAGTVDFSHIGGMTETKKILRETIQWPSKYPKLYSQCPIRMCRGILLYGPPGTGKTLLAGSIAREFGLNFVSIKGPEILSKYIGASEQAVRDLFVRAQAAKPCVLFFDEFDSLAPKRGQDRTGVTDRVVNQLLTQMDGVESLEGVYIVAATSRPDMIDSALLRPGRIDKSILCDHPNEEERLAILKALTKDMHLESKASLKQIAQNSPDYTGADLKAVLYSAQLRAAHRVLDTERNEKRGESPGVSMEKEGHLTSGDAGVKVYKLSSGQFTEVLPEPELQKQVVTLHELSRGQVNKWNTNHGAGRERRRGKVCITAEDLAVALEDVKPSVSVEERQRLTDIYDKFTGKVPQTLKAVVNQRTTMA